MLKNIKLEIYDALEAWHIRKSVAASAKAFIHDMNADKHSRKAEVLRKKMIKIDPSVKKES